MQSTASRSARLCPAGRHSLDPNWDSCPYCEAESRAKEQTVREDYAPSVASNGRVTSIGGTPPPSERKTRIMTTPGTAGPSSPVSTHPGRRIVGVLITYTWCNEGQLWEILEGRNTIGCGRAGDLPDEPHCDITMPNDSEMSSAHALIMYRAGHYELFDNRSTNGTFVNDPEEFVTTQGVELKDNYYRIRTGKTVWTFIKIFPEATATQAKGPAASTASCKPQQPHGPVESGPGDTTLVE